MVLPEEHGRGHGEHAVELQVAGGQVFADKRLGCGREKNNAHFAFLLKYIPDDPVHAALPQTDLKLLGGPFFEKFAERFDHKGIALHGDRQVKGQRPHMPGVEFQDSLFLFQQGLGIA